MSQADSLAADTLRAALGDQLLGHRIVLLAETTSTNDIVAQMAAEHEEGLVVFAERQTAGRGQYGRRWESAPGVGLWFSVLLRPGIAPEESPRLTSWAAGCVAATIREQCGLPAGVKPPNDVYVRDRKVAGVLLEMRAVVGKPHLGILGAGLNVNQAEEDFPAELRESAASLAMLLGQKVNREAIAVALLRELDRTYAKAKKRELPEDKRRATLPRVRN